MLLFLKESPENIYKIKNIFNIFILPSPDSTLLKPFCNSGRVVTSFWVHFFEKMIHKQDSDRVLWLRISLILFLQKGLYRLIDLQR